MSEESSNPLPSKPGPPLDEKALAFVRTWAQSMAQVLQQISGTPLPVECAASAPAAAPAADPADQHLLVSVAGPLQGEMSLRLPKATVLSLAQMFLGEPQDAAAELKPDHRDALTELLRQIGGHVATALKPAWGEVQLRVEAGDPPAWPIAASGWLTSAEGSTRADLEWQLSSALHTALLSPPSAEAAAGEAAVEPPDSTPGTIPDVPPDQLGLLRDVELEVRLRFGECTLRLREILELGPGSVVELDRRIDEPVDLLLDDRLMARGEVVIVDGNYGLRVTEVVAPAGR